MSNRYRRNTITDCLSIIEERTVINAATGCKEWTGPVNAGSYPAMRCDGKMQKVHRLAFIGRFGPLKEDEHVLHRCDNKLCSEPSHLFKGSNAENILDKVEKDRAGKKLNVASALEVAKMVKQGFKQHEVATFFGITQPSVSKIVSGRRRPYLQQGRV